MSQQMKYLDWLFLQGTTLFQNFTQEYIYDGKLLLIAIPIGAQVQQGNMDPVRLVARIFIFDIGKVIRLIGKGFSQTHPPLQVILKLRGPVSLSQSPDKCHQDQLYKANEIISQ